MDGVLQSTRTTILMAFRTLPLLIISFVGFLALGLSNIGLFVLFMGHVMIVPLATMLSQMFFEKIGGADHANLYHVKSNMLGLLVPTSTYSTPHQNVAPSYWMAHSMFFLSYMFSNARALSMAPVDPAIDPILTQNRESKSRTIMITTIFIAIFLSYARLQTHSETLYGVIIAFIFGGILGYLWFQFASLCGAGRADVFGMVRQMVPSSAKKEAPMTCVYSPKP